jgi:hypothetical protein
VIQPQELRIGNLVFYQNEVYEIKALGSHEANLGDGKGTHPYGSISGIPLTGEWLLKFGFERDESVRVENGILTLDLTKSDSPIHDFVWRNNTFGASGSEFHYDMPQIKYVHQLQNLYFTLTGEDLTIRE